MTFTREELAKLHEVATGGKWMASPYSSVVGRGIVAAPEGRMIGSIVEHDDAPGNASLIVLLCPATATQP